MQMKLLCAATVLLWASVAAIADPLVTISCDKPEGSSIWYGISPFERVSAAIDKRPPPAEPKLQRNEKDAFAGKPTFIIDTNRKKITIIWNELPEDVRLRENAKTLGLPMSPPRPATDGDIVQFLDEQISAIQLGMWSITTFSFFPKLETAFINQQAMHFGLENSAQTAAFARCDFSWTNPQ